MTSISVLSLDELHRALNLKSKFCLIGYDFSAECGIPHFNDILKGVWSGIPKTIDPFDRGSGQQTVHSWLLWRQGSISAHLKAKPYLTLAKAQRYLKLHIATQCVDGLIGANGVRQPVELYGNVFARRCQTCTYVQPANFGDLQLAICPQCPGNTWPDVAMFGWNGHEELQREWTEQLEENSLLIQIGVDEALAPFSSSGTNASPRCAVLTIEETGLELSRQGRTSSIAWKDVFDSNAKPGSSDIKKWQDEFKSVEKSWPPGLEKPGPESSLHRSLLLLLWLAAYQE